MVSLHKGGGGASLHVPRWPLLSRDQGKRTGCRVEPVCIPLR